VTWPPDHDRGIRQQQAGDEPLLLGRGRAVCTQHDDLARTCIATDADLGIEPRICFRLGIGILRQHDDAHRVLARGVIRSLDGFFLFAERCGDDESQHASQGDGSTLFADLHQGL